MPEHDITAETILAALADSVQRHRRYNSGIGVGSLNGESQAYSTTVTMGPAEYTSVALVMAAHFQRLPLERVSAYSDAEPPTWGIFDDGSRRLSYPLGISGLFAAGEITEFEMVVQMCTPKFADWREDNFLLGIHVAPEHAEAAQGWVSGLREEAERDFDIFRGRVVEFITSGSTVYPRVIATPKASLDDVVVDATVRDELDKNVLRHIGQRDLLAKIGIGANRGVLLWGPPGTGKTSLVRGIVAAVAGEVTVFVPNSQAIGSALDAVYQEAVRLAPSVVILEDVDVVAADRFSRDAGLAGFLSALDGVVTDPEKMVVTIATTNNPAGIDEAAKRPGRIDRFIEVPLPDEEGRRAILEAYLARLGDGGVRLEIEDRAVANLAAHSAGASGALLREVVRRSLLEAGGTDEVTITTAHLLDAAKEIGYRVVAAYEGGTYL